MDSNTRYISRRLDKTIKDESLELHAQLNDIHESYKDFNMDEVNQAIMDDYTPKFRTRLKKIGERI